VNLPDADTSAAAYLACIGALTWEGLGCMREQIISGKTGRSVALEPIARMVMSTHQKTLGSKVIEFAKFVREMISSACARSAKKTATTRN
jgi:hypothetical protein